MSEVRTFCHSFIEEWFISSGCFDLQAFQTAATEAKNLSYKPSDEDLLELYALYKQVTVGDCNTRK